MVVVSVVICFVMSVIVWAVCWSSLSGWSSWTAVSCPVGRQGRLSVVVGHRVSCHVGRRVCRRDSRHFHRRVIVVLFVILIVVLVVVLVVVYVDRSS